jgi:hypothetical protein
MADNTAENTNPQESQNSLQDYKLGVYLLTSDGKTMVISNVIKNFNLYENIFTPYITGDMQLSDANDLLSNYAFNGNEYLYITLDKPGMELPIEKFFRVYKVSDRKFLSQSLQQYTIHFCSEEMILSSQMLMRKAYKGMIISDIVQDIVGNVLQADPTKLNGSITNTSGSYDLIIPKMQPLQACQWLRNRAHNPDQTAFFFYENRNGYNFISYEDLLTLPTYDTYTRTPKTDTEPSTNKTSFYHIGFFEEFDVLKGNRYGAYADSILTFDLLSRNYNKTVLAAPDVDLKTQFLNAYPFANFSQNRFNKTLFDNEESMQKYYITTDSDTNTNPTQPQIWLMQQTIKLAELNSRRAVLNIPFDPQIAVGYIIELDLPLMRPQESDYQQDKYKSGKYLVASVRHGISVDVASTTLEILSDSVNDELPDAVAFSGTLQDFKKK